MLKGLKKFYRNNRIYCILMIISMLCILTLGIAVIVYFVNQNSSDPYGNRLSDIKSHELGNTFSDLETHYKEQAKVKDTVVRLQGRVIYVTLEVEDETSIEEMQNIATSSLEKISEENLEYYDIQFIITRASYPAYMGSKNSSNKTISWVNYDLSSTEETTTTAKK